MKVNFYEGTILKKYNLNYSVTTEIIDEKIFQNNSTNIEIGWNNDNFELYMIEDIKKEGEGRLDQFLSALNRPFKTLIYKLSAKGEILNLLNYMDIVENWEELKSSLEISSEDNQKLFFRFTGIVNNREVCEELTKRFFIVPYLFIGFYNQELKKNTPLVLDKTLYNIYEMEDIDVRFNITDGSESGEEKIVFLSGKESPNFDTNSFVKKIQSSYPDIPLHKLGNFTLRCLGKYIYSLDDIFKSMEFSINMEIKNLINHTITFKLKENSENEF